MKPLSGCACSAERARHAAEAGVDALITVARLLRRIGAGFAAWWRRARASSATS